MCAVSCSGDNDLSNAVWCRIGYFILLNVNKIYQKMYLFCVGCVVMRGFGVSLCCIPACCVGEIFFVILF